MMTEHRRLELGRFLRDRRARVRPEDVGIASGPRRRVTGLRREEVATLAGVGVTWYTMLENGTADGVSRATLDAIGRALRLSESEIGYVRQLVDDSPSVAPHDAPGPLAAGTLAAIEFAPAYVITNRWDVLAWNRAMSVVWGIEPPGGAPFNIVRRSFLDPAMRAVHGDRFERFARAVIAMLRAGKAHRLDDPAYRSLFTELRDDPVFAAAIADYDIADPKGSVRTTIDSPNVGYFTYEALTLVLPDESGHAIVVQVPDGESAIRLRAQLERTPAISLSY